MRAQITRTQGQKSHPDDKKHTGCKEGITANRPGSYPTAIQYHKLLRNPGFMERKEENGTRTAFRLAGRRSGMRIRHSIAMKN